MTTSARIIINPDIRQSWSHIWHDSLVSRQDEPHLDFLHVVIALLPRVTEADNVRSILVKIHHLFLEIKQFDDHSGPLVVCQNHGRLLSRK